MTQIDEVGLSKKARLLRKKQILESGKKPTQLREELNLKPIYNEANHELDVVNYTCSV